VTDGQKSVWTRLYEKGFWYWFRVALFTALGVLFGQLIGKADIWREVRYKIYHFQTTKLHPSHPHDLQVAFVLIGDDEYWTGPLARRVPIKRDYLARLLRAVEKAHPAVIALDFELRSPTPDGTIVENPEYSVERSELLRAIRDVAERRPIVVPTLLESSMSKHGDAPHEVSNIFGSDLGTARNV